MAINADTVIDRVLIRLAEASTSSPVRWTRAEITHWVNDAIQEFNLITGEIQKTANVSWSDSASIHSVAADCSGLLQVTYSNKLVYRTSLEHLDNELDWQRASAGTKPTRWAPFGLTKFIVHPIATASGNNLSTDYIARPGTITDAASAVGLQDQYVDALEDFAFNRAMFKEGTVELQQAEEAYQRFLDRAGELALRNGMKRRPDWVYEPKAQTTDHGMEQAR